MNNKEVTYPRILRANTLISHHPITNNALKNKDRQNRT